MKVSTLACIQGAWLPDICPQKILDIGAGTGVLSLMAAQRYRGLIDAVEIEQDAYAQLKENIAQSPWSKRINCYHADIRNFAKHNSKKYDVILCNPPFFENQLRSQDPKINKAKHDTGLILKDLIKAAFTLLTDEGKMSILLPPAESQRLIDHCLEKPLFLSDQLVISDTTGKAPNGVITILSKSATKLRVKKMYIKTKNGRYSKRFIHLLKDYYLNI